MVGVRCAHYIIWSGGKRFCSSGFRNVGDVKNPATNAVNISIPIGEKINLPGTRCRRRRGRSVNRRNTATRTSEFETDDNFTNLNVKLKPWRKLHNIQLVLESGRDLILSPGSESVVHTRIRIYYYYIYICILQAYAHTHKRVPIWYKYYNIKPIGFGKSS